MRFVPAALVLAAALSTPRTADAAPPEEHAIQQILVTFRGAERSQSTRTELEARLLAQKARGELEAGKRFADVSRIYNDDKQLDIVGGFVGFVSANDSDPRAWAAIGAAKDGEILGPLKLDAGFYVIQRMSGADAMARLVSDSAVVRIARFGWKGATQSRENRSKETALENASSAITALAATPDFSKLPAVLGAVPFPKPDWQRFTMRRGTQPARLAALEAAAFALKEGAISTKPVETEFGWLVIGRSRYFRCYVSHLVVVHRGAPGGAGQGVKRTKDEARVRCAEALAKLRSDPASWVKIVGEYSDEPDASAREGMLPTAVEPDSQLSPEFIDATERLAPGATSGLVETAFGWHLIRRLN